MATNEVPFSAMWIVIEGELTCACGGISNKVKNVHGENNWFEYGFRQMGKKPIGRIGGSGSQGRQRH